MTKQEVLDLIGKDEIIDQTNVDYSHNENDKRIRNRFRDELRAKLEKHGIISD